MPNSDRRAEHGLQWLVIAVTTLTVLGFVGAMAFGWLERPPINTGGRSAAPAPTPDPTPTPEPTPPPTPAVPPGKSALHAMIVPGEGTCPHFRQRRHGVPEEELTGYLNSMLDCLIKVNEPAFAGAGIPLRRPDLAPGSDVDTSGCVGEIHRPADWAGLYCPANATIYFRTGWSPTEPVHYLDVLIHEFSHHLQNEAAILDSVSAEKDEALTQPNGEIRVQDLSRRVELQAECLTGVMLGPEGPLAVPAWQLDDLVAYRSSVPPQWAATHGSGRAQTRWFERGAYAGGPQRYAACNTFTAAGGLVE